MGVLLALCSALSYGTGDFLGGLGGRRASAAQVSMIVQCVGLIIAALAVSVLARPFPHASILVWGALSGLGSGVGNVSLYRGLASGAMNVVAPVSAVVTAALPAAIGLLTGDVLSLLGWIGLMLVLPGIALVSTATNSTSSASANRIGRGAGWGSVAGCGFGLLFIALDRAGTASGAWPLLPGQIVAVVVVAALSTRPYVRSRRRAGTVGHPAPSWRSALGCGLPSGLGGAGGNLLFLAATGNGELTVVAVMTALYPAITVVLATVFLHERTGRQQALGLLMSAAAVALLTIG